MGIVTYLSLSLSVKTVPTLVEYVGLHGNFFVNCSINIVTLVLSYYVLPDTSGLSLEEIEDLYRPASKKRFAN